MLIVGHLLARKKQMQVLITVASSNHINEKQRTSIYMKLCCDQMDRSREVGPFGSRENIVD